MIFHRGTRVKVKNNPNNKEVTGVIKDTKTVATIFGYSELQYLVVFDGQYIPPEMYYSGDDLEEIGKKPPSPYDCQCGARFTEFPDSHMIYCPKFRRCT